MKYLLLVLIFIGCSERKINKYNLVTPTEFSNYCEGIWREEWQKHVDNSDLIYREMILTLLRTEKIQPNMDAKQLYDYLQKEAHHTIKLRIETKVEIHLITLYSEMTNVPYTERAKWESNMEVIKEDFFKWMNNLSNHEVGK